MTEQQIKNQVNVLKEISEEVNQSKESALKFLIDAGIIKNEPKEQIILTSKK